MNYLLFPSKTNSISLSLNNVDEVKANKKERKIYFKKISKKKLGNIKNLEKFKIIKKLDIYNKNMTKNKSLNKGKINLKINTDILKNINTIEQTTGTVLQTITDEKMLEMANFYLNKEEVIEKSIIGSILSTKRK